jgi:TonB family protein
MMQDISKNPQQSVMQKHGIWISLLAHLLLFGGFSFVWWSNPPDLEKRPSMFIPSYIASQESKPTPIQQPPAPEEKNKTLAQQEKPQPTSKIGIEKPIPKKTEKAQLAAKKPATPAVPAQAARKFQSMASSREEQGVHLIGDEKIDKSLRVILGKAITRHLFYPTSAIEHNVTGTVLIGFTLHPDGQVTNIQLVKPSNAGILNSAALSAINEISPVPGVREYVSEPRFLVVGIIFSGLQEG